MANAREHAAGLGQLRQTYERGIEGWIRRGINGWRFTDTQGNLFRLDEAEGQALHQAAQAKVDELFGSLEGSVWYMLIPAVLVGMLGLRMVDEFALYGMMPTAVYFVPCLAFLFKDAVNEVRFAWAMNNWRGEIARALRERDGGEQAFAPYSLLRDTRLMPWIGYALFGIGMIGFFLAYEDGELFVFFLCLMGAGAFVLRSAYNVD
ncbi:MAG: hypothetical protein ACKOOL_11765 [Novosphingobium sp.]